MSLIQIVGSVLDTFTPIPVQRNKSTCHSQLTDWEDFKIVDRLDSHYKVQLPIFSKQWQLKVKSSFWKHPSQAQLIHNRLKNRTRWAQDNTTNLSLHWNVHCMLKMWQSHLQFSHLCQNKCHLATSGRYWLPAIKWDNFVPSFIRAMGGELIDSILQQFYADLVSW